MSKTCFQHEYDYPRLIDRIAIAIDSLADRSDRSIQHLAESISLASATATAHDVDRAGCRDRGGIQMAQRNDTLGGKASHLEMTRRAALAAAAAVPLSTAPASAGDAVAALVCASAPVIDPFTRRSALAHTAVPS